MDQVVHGDARRKYEELLNGLMAAAFGKSGFDALCTLLRVGGMADANWDVFEESRDAFEDYNWLLNKANGERSPAAARRVALLIYCQAVEMSAPQEVLANLLRCLAGKGYRTRPFLDLGKRKKRDPLAFTPPSAPVKFRRLVELAEQVGETELKAALGRVFDEKIRNAFSHSDYILTEKTFRYSDGLQAREMDLAQLDLKLNECFAFYSAFLVAQHQWLRIAANQKRFHKMPNFEVLELLCSDDEGVYGFRFHFSNGSAAWYTRRRSGIEAVNLFFDKDGQLGFQVGDLGALRPLWMVEGKPVDDWESLP